MLEDDPSNFQAVLNGNLDSRFGSINEEEVNPRRAEFVLNRTSVEGSHPIEIDVENSSDNLPEESNEKNLTTSRSFTKTETETEPSLI